VTVVQLQIDRGDGRHSVLNCSREPVLRQQGGGEIVAECVGNLIVDGIARGSYPPSRPYVVEPRRILALRRFVEPWA
jgi:hypothetical protein